MSAWKRRRNPNTLVKSVNGLISSYWTRIFWLFCRYSCHHRLDFQTVHADDAVAFIQKINALCVTCWTCRRPERFSSGYTAKRMGVSLCWLDSSASKANKFPKTESIQHIGQGCASAKGILTVLLLENAALPYNHCRCGVPFAHIGLSIDKPETRQSTAFVLRRCISEIFSSSGQSSSFPVLISFKDPVFSRRSSRNLFSRRGKSDNNFVKRVAHVPRSFVNLGAVAPPQFFGRAVRRSGKSSFA